MSGHVFVVRGDVTKLRCDARLVPVYETNAPNAIWFQRDESEQSATPADESWRSGAERVRCLGASAGGPALWLAKVGLDRSIGLARAIEGVSEFFKRASTALDRAKLVSGRDKPLLALHLVATGKHNAADRKDDAIVALLACVDQAVARQDVDVVIVARQEEAYAALQVTRSLGHAGVSAALDPSLHALARELAEKARAGDLSALVGAGLSMNAGLPNWANLLGGVARQVSLRAPEPGEDPMRFASWVEQNMGPQAFRAAIAAECKASRHALGHALLASMPIGEFVTLNYDELLEDAARSANAPLVVIPHKVAAAGQRWLLKLHGSVDRPADIVITERDYERFDDWRAAFRGVVEAQLITRHMLFVGFGMTDPNVIRVLDSVARAARYDEARKDGPVGTLLHFEAITEQTRQRYPLRFVHIGPQENNHRPRARQVEILLDEVARMAEDGTHHLLDRRFERLHPGEQAIRKEVTDFLVELHARHPDSRVRREIMRRLRPLMGGDPELTRLSDAKPPVSDLMAPRAPDDPLHPGR